MLGGTCKSEVQKRKRRQLDEAAGPHVCPVLTKRMQTPGLRFILSCCAPPTGEDAMPPSSYRPVFGSSRRRKPAPATAGLTGAQSTKGEDSGDFRPCTKQQLSTRPASLLSAMQRVVRECKSGESHRHPHIARFSPSAFIIPHPPAAFARHLHTSRSSQSPLWPLASLRSARADLAAPITRASFSSSAPPFPSPCRQISVPAGRRHGTRWQQGSLRTTHARLRTLHPQ